MSKSRLIYVFCPFCGLMLDNKEDEGAILKYCREHGTFYPQHDIAVSGVAIRFNTFTETLMVQRNQEPHKGKWSFPAGFVNFGEEPKDALIREVREETGLTVVRYKLLEDRVSDDDPRSPKQQSRRYKIVVRGEIKNSRPEEIAEIKWQSLNPNLPDLPIAWPNHERLFKILKKDALSIFPQLGWISRR